MSELRDQTPCPKCGGWLSRVIDTERAWNPDIRCLQTLRRRICLTCRGRYTTRADERPIPASYSSATLTLTIEITPPE